MALVKGFPPSNTISPTTRIEPPEGMQWFFDDTGVKAIVIPNGEFDKAIKKWKIENPIKLSEDLEFIEKFLAGN